MKKLISIALLFLTLIIQAQSPIFKELSRQVVTSSIIEQPLYVYPPEIDVNKFEFGTYSAATAGLPATIVEGTTFDYRENANSGDRGVATIVNISPDAKRRFHTYYPRHAVFNADDTWMKFLSADTWDSVNGKWVGGAQAFVPVATAGDPSTYFYTGVDGGGFWSNVDPDLLYVNIKAENKVRMQTRGVAYTGFETVLFDFDLAGFKENGWGMNEGNMSWDDKYMAFNCIKTSDGNPYAVILDIEDCKANPGGPNNIHSTMQIADNGGSIIDWISVSPSGDYFIIAYFGEFTINPITGNSIIVYDNTAGSPTLKTNYFKTNSAAVQIDGCAVLQESHSALAIDQNGADVWVGYKQNAGCSADGQEAQGGCMGYDESTYVIMARFSDGAVKYLFSDFVDPRGYFTGYISATNTKRPGWAYLDEGGRTVDGAASTDMMALKLSWDNILSPTGNLMEFYGRSYAEEDFNPTAVNGTPGFENQGVPSRNGTMIAFDSYFVNATLYGLHEPSPTDEGGDMGRNQGTAFLLKYPQN